jgi:hypothetical protein
MSHRRGDSSSDDRVAAARKRRAARLLGDLLPSETTDDSPSGWGQHGDDSAREAQLRRDVPPHHGG